MRSLATLLAAALTLGIVFNPGRAKSFAAAGDPESNLNLKAAPNPDPQNVRPLEGNATIVLKPRNDERDYRNLQWAVDNAAPGGTVQLGEGTFFMGDGVISPRRTVWIRQGLRITGKRNGDAWLSIVRGGGEQITPGVGGSLESGPFRILNESDLNPSVFEDLWLRQWACEAIFVVACHGFEVRRCRISEPVNTTNEDTLRFVHALWSTGARARGDFIVEDNLVEMGGYDDRWPNDEQFLGLWYANHDNVRVTNNVIVGVDEAIEICGNRSGEDGKGKGAPTSPAEMVISGNRIDLTQTLAPDWKGTYAFLIGGNLGMDAVRIENNDLTMRGKGWAFGLSGERLNITGNRVRFETHEGKDPAGAVYIGFGKLGRNDMGPSLIDSVFENNLFEGKVSGYAMQFGPSTDNVPGILDTPNASRGNRIDLGDSLAKLGAKVTLEISKDVHGNTFKGALGTLRDNSPEGANSY